ncbi:MAG TPA: oxygen-independent coproporphyrinogen III oxidase [Burkholderiales bacterium]|nr:oxygen-independent coproporphyrinogen III oxidase [Burkholderiales bacterium]
MSYPSSDLVIDPVLIRKYDVSGPRYTSYPTADRFTGAFDEAAYRQALRARNPAGAQQPLSLYAHVPFCRNVCFYCACNKVVTRDAARARRYVDQIATEIAMTAGLLGGRRQVRQVHWGGGTPTFLGEEGMQALCAAIDAHFERVPGSECSIEVDPREAGPGTMAFLADLGFNRVSFGVQDFDPAVQAAVNRIQPEALTRDVVAQARATGFRSINLDLIYGLPKQTLDSFSVTLDKVLELDPDRIALYAYAHLPGRFKPQRRIAAADLPTAEARLQIMTLAIGRLTRAGYHYIGMDHFAKPGDDLAAAQAQGRLHRNFQGYSTLPEGDMLGFGVSAIGRVGTAYVQNEKVLEGYGAAVQANRLPAATGFLMGRDDLLRRAVIQALMCQFRLSIEAVEAAHLVDFHEYFGPELALLRRLEDEGLVQVDRDWIVVTPVGRLLVRAVCMVFDRYLREARSRAGYSRVL